MCGTLQTRQPVEGQAEEAQRLMDIVLLVLAGEILASEKLTMSMAKQMLLLTGSPSTGQGTSDPKQTETCSCC